MTADDGRVPVPAFVDDVLDLALGRCCVGCGAPSGVLCAACRARLSVPCLVLPARHAVAANEYAGLAAQAVISFKEHGLRPLHDPLGQRLALAVACALESSPARAKAGAGLPRVALVPVPSHRNRDFDHARMLASSACARLAHAGLDAVMAPLLTGRSHAPLKHLGREARAKAIRGAFEVRPPRGALPGLLAGRIIVIVDDVITSGATTSEAARALLAHALPVHAIASVAATSLAVVRQGPVAGQG